MSIALRFTAVLILAALAGCGADASPSVGADQSAVSSGEPNPSAGEVVSSPGTTAVKQPDSGAVDWQDRVDYDKWEPPLPPGQDGWPTEPPSRWPELKARLRLPQEVRPGETVDYLVVLRNVSDDAVDLLPCGGYRQEVLVVGAGMAAEPVDGGESAFRLNCDSDPTLFPNESRRYMMRLVVPDVATGDEVLFTWGLVDNMPDYDSQEWIRLSTD